MSARSCETLLPSTPATSAGTYLMAIDYDHEAVIRLLEKACKISKVAA